MMAAMSTSIAPLAMPQTRALSGPEKVAVLLLAMETQLASGLLKQFSADELRIITRSAAELGAIPIPALERLIEEFAGHFSTGADLVGSADGAEQMLAHALPPEEVSDIMADALGAANTTIWERLSGVGEAALCAYLSTEHPQTAALILSKVTTASAAKVLSQMPSVTRNALTRRMLGLKHVPEPMVKLIEGVVQTDLIDAGKNPVSMAQTRMADIINRLDREQVDDLLTSLSAERPETAEILKGMLFSFEDIVTLGEKARLALFERVPAETVILALKGSEAELRDMVLASLAARARRMVEQELAGGEASDARDVAAARRAIADTVLDLSERGLIDLHAA